MQQDKRLKEERDQDLNNAYLRVLSLLGDKVPQTSIEEIAGKTSRSPAKRFYISEERAARYIAQMERGRLCKLSPMRKMLCDDLWKVYQRIKQDKPYISKSRQIGLAVHSPAPRFYISTKRTIEILFPQDNK